MKLKPTPKASIVDGLDDCAIAQLLRAARKPMKRPLKRAKEKQS